MTRLEALVDAIKTTPPSCASRRDALLELATAMTADARGMLRGVSRRAGTSPQEPGRRDSSRGRGAHGRRERRRGGAQPMRRSRGGAHGGGRVAGGRRVPATARRRARLPPPPGRTIRVHESSWEEAGLAWRIWGASRILAHALDAAAAAERRSHTAETIATGTDDVPVSSTSPRAVPEHRDDPSRPLLVPRACASWVVASWSSAPAARRVRPRRRRGWRARGGPHRGRPRRARGLERLRCGRRPS